jgi:hypothetical protein
MISLLTILILSCAQSTPQLFADTNVQANSNIGSQHQTLARRTVDVDLEVLRHQQAVIDLNVFANVNLQARFLSLETSPTGGDLWRGKVIGHGDSTVLFAFRDNTVMGTIRYEDKLILLEDAGNGVHRLLLVDQLKMPSCGNDMSHSIKAKAKADDAVNSRTGSPEITVMVVYTTEAKNSTGGNSQMENKIDLAITETNDSFADSGLGQRVELVYYDETIGYTEAPTFGGILDDLRINGDGKIDWVHDVRNQVAADMVDLICDNYQYCGLAYLMTNVTASFEQWCFSVVNYSCAVGADVFAHELGHNMGSHHDVGNAGGGSGAYSYSFGYRTPNNALKTVMAYYPGAVTGRWSGPNVTYNGNVMGTTIEDNVRSLDNTANMVASFRNGAPVQPPSTISFHATTLIAGGFSILSVENATPNSQVYFAYSLAGGDATTTPYGLAYLTYPINVMTLLTTTGTGFGSYAVSPPPLSSGLSVWMQAHDVTSGVFSNGVYKYIF